MFVKQKKSIQIPAQSPSTAKKKRRDKSDLGSDFIAPDGGWGWVVCLAAGFSNFAIFPPLQQYGLIYRQRMSNLNFDAKQTTTIVNIIMAVSSLVGIVNGAMFRRFTFRQVGITGSILVFLGILLTVYCTAFWHYIVSFSCIYGIGFGLCMASTSLAVNTYFKHHRRRATGFSWTITGLGPIIFPHISTILSVYYGTQGTILIYSGIALNAIVCALTLQPVLWHAQKPIEPKTDFMLSKNKDIKDNRELTISYECKHCQCRKHSKHSLFSSQYLFNDDDDVTTGYEITEPAIPMLAKANDGWFGSKLSLHSEKNIHGPKKIIRRFSQRSENQDADNLSAKYGKSNLYKPNNFNREYEESDLCESCTPLKCLNQSVNQNIPLKVLNTHDIEIKEEQDDPCYEKKLTFREKIIKFFDLDLLKDYTFVNLAMGMTVMLFGEVNFSVLTPFILGSYGYSNEEISIAMSLLAATDICVRILAPFALEKVKLSNQKLFSFGISAICVGRFLVTMSNSLNMILITFLIIGFGKGFRTIFSPLIIPSYVPLNRLPAASGLQLIFNTIFSCIFGPILGIVTDATNYTITIHFINGCTCAALLMWAYDGCFNQQ